MDLRIRVPDTKERELSFVPEKPRHWKLGKSLWQANYRITGNMANPTVVWRLDNTLCSGRIYVSNGIIFSGQIKAKSGQKSYKDLYSIRIRKIMLRKERKNGKKNSLFNIWGGSYLPWCQLFLFLVNLILRSPASGQDQMSGWTFLSCEICTPRATPLTVGSRVSGRVLSTNLIFAKTS